MRTAILLLFLATVAMAGDMVSEVPPGKLRSQLFELARPTLEKTAGYPVKFQGSLKANAQWAFFLGQIVDPQGKTIRLGEAESGDAVALWQQKDGKWKLVVALAGVTDAPFVDWPREYGAPEALFQ